jgi:hypothetical protein
VKNSIKSKGKTKNARRNRKVKKKAWLHMSEIAREANENFKCPREGKARKASRNRRMAKRSANLPGVEE